MIVNFEIENHYVVQFQGRHIDLHNNFDLVEILDFQDSLEMEFRKSAGDWAKKEDLNKLLFSFKNISYKYEEAGEEIAHSKDWQILGNLSFFPNNMRDVNDGIIPQKLPKEQDDIIFFFENGSLLRIHCKEIILSVA